MDGKDRSGGSTPTSGFLATPYPHSHYAGGWLGLPETSFLIGATPMASTDDIAARLKSALADRYSIEGEIGSGGMATVFLAEDLKHRRKVAIKVLKPELSAVVGSERFLAEIETTANLQHPNIVRFYGLEQEGRLEVNVL